MGKCIKKTDLIEAFESQYSVFSSQLQVNSTKMNHGKTVKSYAERILFKNYTINYVTFINLIKQRMKRKPFKRN